MKKTLPLFISLCCIGAGATANNYDLLGRRGSQMNSPMVYKNVDYLKTKKQQQQEIGAPVEAHSLQKTGMPDNVKAVTGAYRSLTSSSNDILGGGHVSDAHYFLKRYYADHTDACGTFLCNYNWNYYRNRLNSVFIPINTSRENDPANYAGFMYSSSEPTTSTNVPGWTTLEGAGYSVSFAYANGNASQTSPYNANQSITYRQFDYVKNTLSKASKVPNWYDGKATDVGIYMGADGLPVQLGLNRFVGYIRNNSSESFQRAPGYEMRDSRTYALAKHASNHPVIYVGRSGNPANPAGKTPQVYIGVRNNGIGKSLTYSSTAKALDNYIYQYRTIEFVPAGNYGQDNTNPGYLNSKGYAANAITVGALETVNGAVTPYTSTKVCTNCSKKPEIYNYSHMMMDDLARTYEQSNGRQFNYQPFYDGTEMAAAYTAGMVSNLLSINPFYRWHPEVVKALLLTSNPLDFTSSTKKAPTYKYLVFDDVGDKPDFDYDSRFWNGSIDKLRTRVNQHGQSEIWFVTSNPGTSNYPASAAISWLSSGNDISNIGRIPQDFDIEVYGTNNSNYVYLNNPHLNLGQPYTPNSSVGALSINFDNPGTYINGSYTSTNSFEKIRIASDYDYLIFRIVLATEDSRSENKGEIVLGFNMTSAEYRPNR